MNPLLSWTAAVSGSASAALIAATWQGLLLAVCAAVCLLLFPRVSAAARSMVWLAVFGLDSVLHFSSFAPSSAVSATHAGWRVDVCWALGMAGLWAILSAIRTTQLIISAIHLRRIARRAVPIPAEALAADLRLGRRAVELCLSSDVDRPCVAGFFAPRILVPGALLARLSAGELEQVVLHEMEHIRRGDTWTNLLQKVMLAVFPLNPVLLWVERRLCAERELACDDRVLERTGARKAYATCLTNLAEHTILRRGAMLALGAWEKQTEVARRVHRILRAPEAAMGRGAATLASVTLAVGLGAGAITLAHAPQLIRFAPAATQNAAVELAPWPGVEQGSRVEKMAHPTLVKASMPMSAQPAGAEVKPHRRPKMAASPLRRRVAEPQWRMVTEWRPAAPRARMVLTVYEDLRPSYAAVPMGDGWLIIQL